MGFIVLDAVLLRELGLGLLRMLVDIFSKVGVVHGETHGFGLPGAGLMLLMPHGSGPPVVSRSDYQTPWRLGG